MDTISIQFVSFITGIVLMPIYFYIHRHEWDISNLNIKGMAWATFAHIFTLVASFSYLRALLSVNVTTVTLTTSAYPIITFMLAVVLLDEKITIWKLIGIPIVIFGVWISGKT